MKKINGVRFGRWMALGCLAFGLAVPQLSSANHPVKVEGDTDVDGDGRVGQAEDNDGPGSLFAGKPCTIIGQLKKNRRFRIGI